MVISKKKILANRENGKSGGVKTERGKSISSQNSQKHGILAYGETKYDFIKLSEIYQELVIEFGDKPTSRRILVEQLALTYLRLTRCSRLETELLKEALNPPIYEEEKKSGFIFLEPESTERKLIAKNDMATLGNHHFQLFELVYLRYGPALLKQFIGLRRLLQEDQNKSLLGSFGENANTGDKS